MTEDFPSRLANSLLIERIAGLETLSSCILSGESEDVRSFFRGTLHAVERMRACPDAESLKALVSLQAEFADRSHDGHYGHVRSERSSRLSFLWHLGQYVAMEAVAKRLKIYARN